MLVLCFVENVSTTSTRSRSPILSQRPSYAALKDEMTESMTEQSERPMGAQGDHGDSYDITTSSLEATDSLSDPRVSIYQSELKV